MTPLAINPRKALNKAYLKVKPNRSAIELYKSNLIELLDRSNDTESEEFHKNLVSDFLKKTYYDPNHFINTKGRNDLVIHNGKEAKSTVGVIIEAKKPTNKAEMLKKDKLNCKALHELVLYFLRERISQKNLEIKYLVATNIYEWFIFDAQLFEKLFAQNKKLVKQFEDFEAGRLGGTKTDFFYKEIAGPFIDQLDTSIEFTHFDLKEYEKPLRNEDKKDDNKLIALFKLLSPEHLLKLPFTNDSNSLDKKFYSELLHIIGLTETKDGGKKIIQRNKAGERNTGSLLENAVIQLDTLDKIHRLDKPSQYGETHEERLFNVGLELSITWVNRILFLKLLEAQLIAYHKGDESYSFLNYKRIKDYDDLNSLFFQVLAKKHQDRNEKVKEFFKVPYLNSSLFEPNELEHRTILISNLENDEKLPIHPSTVLKDENGKKRTGELNALEYFFAFLEAYDFSSEGAEDIQEDNKTLINASVLGLIFEKINGYKDGSFFTPGFITMYMCRETIRRSVVQKFNDTKGWSCKDLDELYDKIEDRKEANDIVNSLKICDPAVGSGHFLVSALNEMIAIKNDLRILQDREGKRLKEYHFEVVNDELVVTDDDGGLFEYTSTNKEAQRVQETLFHEKQTIIENCLFGVDINPNSVKICRLRLWIELLKNAYYKNETELETLPNIDINIKCGNSLISRFDLDADIKEALKKSKWSIDSYRLAVDSYRNAQSKEEKHEMERLINDIKSDFRSEVSKNDPKLKRLYKLSGELANLTTQTSLFDMAAKEKKEWNKKVEKLAGETKKLETEIEEIKNNKIYENAFEWRFEFPEVLNNEGDFIGFDTVIGNPPYGVQLSEFEISYYRLNYKSVVGHAEIYYMFIELGLSKILSSNNLLSFIIPNAWLSNKYAKGVRELILKANSPFEIINFNQKIIFEDAQVETSILTVLKSLTSRQLFVGQDLNSKYKFDASLWLKDDNLIINFSESSELQLILEKINSSPKKLEDILDISNGCKPYQAGYGKNNSGAVLSKNDVVNRIYHAREKLNDQYYLELKGKHIQPYLTKESTDFIKWGDWLMSPKNSRYYFQKKILIRQIIGNRFICTIDESGSIADQSLYVAVSHVNSEISMEAYLAILNSALYGFYFRKFYSEEDDLFPKIKVNELKRLPAVNLNIMESNSLESKVTQILDLKKADPAADTSALEAEIDQLVYALYGLTEEEIKIVEESVK